jgi:uncharacterized protein YukE
MSAGFQVILSDLDDMAGTFTSEVGTYQAISAKLNPPVADSGDGSLNETMQSVLNLLSYLQGKMAESIDEHATNLRSARDAYQKNETDIHGLYNDLMPEGW